MRLQKLHGKVVWLTVYEKREMYHATVDPRASSSAPAIVGCVMVFVSRA
jgi:hypothetical protein